MSEHGPGYELALFTIARDIHLLSLGLPYLRHFLGPDRVSCVASASCLEEIRKAGIDAGLDLADEDRVVPGLSLALVKKLVEERGGKPARAGWYFKQIALLAYAMRAETASRYLVWDTDTIPIRSVALFDGEGRALLATKRGYHAPYFATMEKLLGYGRAGGHSFIAEHMMFDRDCVRQLASRILRGGEFDGEAFARMIMGAVPSESLSGSGFSEYETYGNFMLRERPGSVAIGRIASIRHGTALFGSSPSPAQLFAASILGYRWVTFEEWKLSTAPKRAIGLVARLAGSVWTALATRLFPAAFERFEAIPRGA